MSAASIPVLHVLDRWRNLDTRYFRSLLDRQSGGFDPSFCLVDEGAAGPWVEGRFANRVMTLAAASRWSYLWATVRLATRLRGRKVALVHAHFFYPTLLAVTAGRLAHVPVVFTRHHSDHNIRLNKSWHVRADALSGRLANHVIAVSAATKRMMTDIEHVPGTRISVVYNGMDPLSPPPPTDIARARAEVAPQGGQTCLMVARLHEEKGHRVLFEAIPLVANQVPAVQFVLAGEGPHRAMLEAQARALGVAGRVRFLGQRSDISALLTIADVVVLPSLAESFGYALVEAMSLGRPIVASDSGGIPEVVAEGETGLIVPVGDVEALARALVRLLTDQDLANRLGSAGPRRAALFSFDRMIEGYESVYRQVLRAPDHGRPPPDDIPSSSSDDLRRRSPGPTHGVPPSC